MNSREARQFRVKPNVSKLVYQTMPNLDGTKRYKVRQVIYGYEESDFAETYAYVEKLTTFLYVISLVRKHCWRLDQLHVVTAFPNP